MIAFVTGGAGSGKSAYAEELTLTLKKDNHKLYYVATMHSEGEEAEERIIKHRRQREGKNFVTLELPYGNAENCDFTDSAVLLEDVPNLVANLMFESNSCLQEMLDTVDTLADRITSAGGSLVLVGADVFEDGTLFDELTDNYIRTLAKVYSHISEMSDSITEVVCGLPQKLK